MFIHSGGVHVEREKVLPSQHAMYQSKIYACMVAFDIHTRAFLGGGVA
jgi:hypothetical protein